MTLMVHETTLIGWYWNTKVNKIIKTLLVNYLWFILDIVSN